MRRTVKAAAPLVLAVSTVVTGLPSGHSYAAKLPRGLSLFAAFISGGPGARPSRDPFEFDFSNDTGTTVQLEHVAVQLCHSITGANARWTAAVRSMTVEAKMHAIGQVSSTHEAVSGAVPPRASLRVAGTVTYRGPHHWSPCIKGRSISVYAVQLKYRTGTAQHTQTYSARSATGMR